jgi:predicted ArsR family transcriptional regulator
MLEIMSNERSLVLEGLDQYRAYAHPLRRKILELALEPVTAKSLAASMEVSTTRVYRHLDALCDVGLLEVVREVPKRGVVERWFQAVQRDDDYRDLKQAPEGLTRVGAAQMQIRLPAENAAAILQKLVDAATPYHDEEGEPMILTISLDSKGVTSLPTEDV